MKILGKFLIGLLIFITMIFIACSVAVGVLGKKTVISQIERNLKLKAGLDNISFGLPFSVNITGLEVGNLLKAKEISAHPSILGLFAGKVILSDLTIIDPVINIEQAKDGSLNLPKLEEKGESPPVLLTGLSVRNGRFIFTDKKVADDYKVVLDKVNADIAKVKLPLTSLNTKFKLSAFIANSSEKTLGLVDFSGWIDFGPKDMDAVLEIRDLDVTYFLPYLGDFISKRKLISAKLDFSSMLRAENNNLNVVSRLKLSSLAYETGQLSKEGELPGLDFAKNALDFFADDQGNVIFDFVINTKLDDPKLDQEKLRRVMMEAAARNLSRQSPQSIIEKVTGNIEQFKEIGEQLKNIFKKKGE